MSGSRHLALRCRMGSLGSNLDHCGEIPFALIIRMEYECIKVQRNFGCVGSSCGKLPTIGNGPPSRSGCGLDTAEIHHRLENVAPRSRLKGGKPSQDRETGTPGKFGGSRIALFPVPFNGTGSFHSLR
jgi:hypothetical protein